MEDKFEHKDNHKWRQIPIWLLATVLITFIVGVVVVLLVQSILLKNQLTLSPVAVISFVFTVALGAAAIILAIMTTILSRQAEEALMKRSDEGIKLQNDVFVRTNEVLSKIQASTGVTEKRIEDIISGRTSIIAQEVLDKSLHGETALSGEMLERLKKDLAESLRSELIPLIGIEPSDAVRKLSEMETRQRTQLEIKQRWKEFRRNVVNAVKNIPGIKLVCEAEGSYSGEIQEEFWDAVMILNGKNMALDIHTKEQISDPVGAFYEWAKDPKTAQRVAYRVGWRAYQDGLDYIFIVWDQDVSQETGFIAFSKALEAIRKDFLLHSISGSPEEVASQLATKFPNT